jgi:phenylacetate-CoA ligase
MLLGWSMPILEPAVETLGRAQLERLQFERLQALFERMRDGNDFCRERFGGVTAPRALADLPALPFTKKSDLRDAYPLKMLQVPIERLARIHASSGTSGVPTIGPYTKRDLEIFAEVNARSLASGGARPGDLFQISWGYGLFTGGLGMHGGAERLGACVIPASSGNTARQMQLLETLPIAGIGCTPSYAVLLAERFEAEQRRPLALRYLIAGAEAWTPQMRDDIERRLGVIATNIYGLTEIIGPGVAQECPEAKAGLHIQEDHFLPEIIDPATLQPLPDGTLGELVITTLTREAMPVLRYRTGDLTSIRRERCACGRTTARMAWITGRVDNMLVIRGINVFPTAIEELLLGFTELTPNYQIIVERPPNGLDTLHVEVEHRSAARYADHRALESVVAKKLAEFLLVTLTIRVVAPGTLARVEAGKAKRVDDRRTLA